MGIKDQFQDKAEQLKEEAQKRMGSAKERGQRQSQQRGKRKSQERGRQQSEEQDRLTRERDEEFREPGQDLLDDEDRDRF